MNRSDLITFLESDPAFNGLMTGGIYSADEISRQITPDAFGSNKEIKPCCLVKIENQSPNGPYRHSSKGYLVLWFYQRSGYDQIDLALLRAYQLLHRSKPLANLWSIQHAEDSGDHRDEALDSSLRYSRLEFWEKRA